MAEEQGFAQARARLEEIVVQVRKKDTSLEQSLDLLEEGVRLANQCTELVDHAEWRPSIDQTETDGAEETAEEFEGGERAEAVDSPSRAEGATDVATGVAIDAGGAGTDAADEYPETDEQAGTPAVLEARDEADEHAAADADEYDDIFADED